MTRVFFRTRLSEMLRPVIGAELLTALRRPILYLCAAIFFFLAFQTIAITSPTASGLIRIGRLWHNSPYVVAKLIASLSVVATLAAAVLIAPAIHRDFQHRTDAFFLASPITRLDYLLGRFTGAYLATFIVFVAAEAGMLAAALSIPSEFNGPFRAATFLAPLLTFAVPNLLLTGAFFFAVATLTRRMLTTYIAAVVAMMLLGIAQGISSELLQNAIVTGPARYFVALAEPFGGAVLQVVTSTWSPSEKNTRAIPLLGLLLVHRLVWTAVALGLLVFVWRKFKPVETPRRRFSLMQRLRRLEELPPASSPLATFHGLRNVTLIYTLTQRLRQYAVLTRRELSLTVRHLAFIVLGIATLANLHSNFVGNVQAQGIYPRTGFFIEYGLRVSSFVIILTIFFAGTIVWREREHRIHQIVDSQPLPTAVIYGSKLSALLMMQLALAILITAFGIVVQAAFFGYTHFEIGRYISVVFGVHLLGWWTIAVIAFLIQATSPNVYVGYGLAAVVIGAASVLPNIGVADGIWRPGFTPAYSYSDMNGLGHFTTPVFWYRVYWGFAAVFLGTIASLLWPRGGIEGLVARLRLVHRRMTAKARATIVTSALGAATTGGFIVYNTDVLNGATHSDRIENLRASYETSYRRFLSIEQPSIDAVDVSADFYPSARRLAVRGTMRLKNRTHAAIRNLHVTLLPTRLLTAPRMELDAPTSHVSADNERGYTVFTLATSLPPDSTLTLDFEYTIGARGFSDQNSDGHLVHNGSVVLGSDPAYFPQVGYQSDLELIDTGQRLKHGLVGSSSAMSVADDRSSLEREFPAWISFTSTVSTNLDQTPVANGTRVRTWIERDRRYATYVADHVIGRTFVLASGVYARKAERVGPVEVEILYHPDHAYNLRSMFAGVKCGLDYGARNFAPYPHKSLRIVELPMYTMSGNARAVSTVFLWGELGGFIREVGRDPGIDRVYSTAVHETAHQWWGGSVRVLNEALSDYVRLGCLEKAFGDDATAELVREATRSYFIQRERTIQDERPLRDGYQYYSQYAIMWRLRRLLGEPAVNAALHDVVQEFGYRSDRRPTAAHVANAIHRHAPKNLQPIVADLFDRITLHSIRAIDARSQRLSDGRYRLTLSADLRKSYGNERGENIPAPLTGYVDYIDVGAYGKAGEKLAVATLLVTDPRGALSMIVDREPATVVLDPLGTLLDPDPSDNRVSVRLER
ncbi:MAG: hypothetical protein ACSLFK_12655 [Gemmatimonadaceae bacterium]